MRRHGRMRRFSLPVVCLLLLLVIAVVYVTDFPRSIVLPKSEIRDSNKPTQSLPLVNSHLRDMVYQSPTEKTDNGQRPTEKTDNGQRPTEKTDNGQRPTEKTDNGQRPTEKTDNGQRPTEKTDNGQRPTEKTDNGQRPTQKTDNGQRPTEKTDNGQRPAQKTDNGQRPTEKTDNGQRPTEKTDNGQRPTEKTDYGQRPTEKTDNKVTTKQAIVTKAHPPTSTNASSTKSPVTTEREAAPGTIKTSVDPANTTKTTLLDDDRMVRIEKRFQLRRERVAQYCQNTKPRQIKKCEADSNTGGLKYVEGSKLLYCAIEKTGSTFWKRILHVAGGWSNNSSPHSIKSVDADQKHGGFKVLVNVTYNELDKIFQMTKTIMFVRDPLARLFSAWLDKFYSVNPFYWTLYGRKMIIVQRKNATNSSRTCGHDVTFPEFVNFVAKYVKNDRCLDRHFNPNFKHCAPCVLSYDYIGKYETLKEDTYFLLQKLNLTEYVKFKDFENDAINDVITNDADWVFRKRNETKDCVPFRCSLFRVWKRLQSRGIISKRLEFPYTSNKEANNVTMEEFTQAIVAAHKKSSPEELSRNRAEVLHEAFGLLPEDVKTRMVSALQPDFDLYDYDRNPSFLKGNSTRKIVPEYTNECPYTFDDP